MIKSKEAERNLFQLLNIQKLDEATESAVETEEITHWLVHFGEKI